MTGPRLNVPGGIAGSGDVFALPGALREALVPALRTEVTAMVATAVATRIDTARAGVGCGDLTDLTGPLLRAADRHVRAKVVDAANSVYRHPSTDLQVTVKVLAHPGDPAAYLGIVTTEIDRLRAVVMGLPGIADFSYWPQEDPTEEWLARGNVWQSALRNGRADLAWTWSLLGPRVAMDLDLLVPRPSADQVVAALPCARDRAWELTLFLVEGKAGHPDRDNIGAFVHRLQELRNDALPAALNLIADIGVGDVAVTLP